MTLPPDLYGQIDPPHRLLMGPGPVNAHPRVLRAMTADLLGQFDPEMTGYMNEVMALYRPIFGTENRWTFLIDGTARAGIEAALVSLLSPGDTLLVIDFGRFGLLLREIGERIGAHIEMLSVPWGQTVPVDAIAAALERCAPKAHVRRESSDFIQDFRWFRKTEERTVKKLTRNSPRADSRF